MSLLKELPDKGATTAWCNVKQHPKLLALGTKDSAGAGFDDYGGELELHKLDFVDEHADTLLGKVKTSSRFAVLAWSEMATRQSDFSYGLIAGGMGDGTVNVWDPAKLVGNHAQPQVASVQRHKGPVNGLQFNPHPSSSQLLASGGADNEVYIMNLERPDAPNVFVPSQPPNATKHCAEVTKCAWNTKVSHILATSAMNGSTIVWDLRSKKPWCELRDSVRASCTACCWNPEEGMNLVTASGDDNNPVLKLWDLRGSTSLPLATLSGHTQGILSCDWCPHDTSLLVSCGKDNRTIVWDLFSMQPVFELPSGGPDGDGHGHQQPQQQMFGAHGNTSTRRYQVSWSPEIPAVLSTCSFDRKVQLFSMQGFKSSSGRAPKWLNRPCGASFGFGGKLVNFGKKSAAAAGGGGLGGAGVGAPGAPPGGLGGTQRGAGEAKVVQLSSVAEDPQLVQSSRTFEETMVSRDFRAFCEAKDKAASDAYDKQVWQFMKVIFEKNAREQLLSHLGFDAEEIAKEAANYIQTGVLAGVKAAASGATAAVGDKAAVGDGDAATAGGEAGAGTGPEPVAAEGVEGLRSPRGVVDTPGPPSSQQGLNMSNGVEATPLSSSSLVTSADLDSVSVSATAGTLTPPLSVAGDFSATPSDGGFSNGSTSVKGGDGLSGLSTGLEAVDLATPPMSSFAMPEGALDGADGAGTSSLFSPAGPGGASAGGGDFGLPPTENIPLPPVSPSAAAAAAAAGGASPPPPGVDFGSAPPADGATASGAAGGAEGGASTAAGGEGGGLEGMFAAATQHGLLAHPPVTMDVGAETLIKRALLVGNFEAAVQCCLQTGNMADALLLASCGGADLWAKTQAAYFVREAASRPFLHVVSAIIKSELGGLVQSSDLSRWPETLAILSTYAKSDEFPALCETLGSRLEAEVGDRRSANLCYMCAVSVTKTIGIWLDELRVLQQGEEGSKDTRALHAFVEKVSIFSQAEPGTPLQPEVLDMFAQYAHVLAAEGELEAAMKYSSGEVLSGAILQDRLYKSNPAAFNGAPVPTFPFEGPKVVGVSPQEAGAGDVAGAAAVGQSAMQQSGQQGQHFGQQAQQQQHQQQQQQAPAGGAGAAGGAQPLPPGWTQMVDPSRGIPYYCNQATGETQWERPAPPPAAAAAPQQPLRMQPQRQPAAQYNTPTPRPAMPSAVPGGFVQQAAAAPVPAPAPPAAAAPVLAPAAGQAPSPYGNRPAAPAAPTAPGGYGAPAAPSAAGAYGRPVAPSNPGMPQAPSVMQPTVMNPAASIGAPSRPGGPGMPPQQQQQHQHKVQAPHQQQQQQQQQQPAAPSPAPAPTDPAVTAPAAAQASAECGAIVAALNQMLAALTGSVLNAPEKKMLGQVNVAVAVLYDKMGKGELESEVLERVATFVHALQARDMQTAGAVNQDLSSNYWSLHKDWIAKLKHLIRLCARL